jgi:hypothetical protein
MTKRLAQRWDAVAGTFFSVAVQIIKMLNATLAILVTPPLWPRDLGKKAR